jgi:hypothetical protein
VEIGQLELSSSATITVDIPSASASNFIDQTGSHCGVMGICLRVYAISDGNKVPQYDFQTLTVSAYDVIQTYQQNTVTMTILNNSNFPVAFTTMYISGPDGVSNYYLTTACTGATGLPPTTGAAPCYINEGQSLVVQLPFVWRTDQSYVATLNTNKGLTFSTIFVSP